MNLTISSPNLLMWSVFFDCNFTCDFCFVHDDRTRPNMSGAYKRFKDLTYHDYMIDFIDKLAEQTGKWTILLTGGEPLLMPNLSYLTSAITRHGHKLRYNTNLSIPIESNSSWRAANPPDSVEAFVVSIHPQSMPRLNSIINRIKLLKQFGYSLIVRMVAHPSQLYLLEDLDQVFKALNVTFAPLPLLTGGYPKAYTKEQFVKVRQYTKGYAELLCLYGGASTEGRICHAGSKTLYIQSRPDKETIDDISPCISVNSAKPLENYLGSNPIRSIDELVLHQPVRCLREKPVCNCPALFEHNILIGCETRQNYNELLRGFTEPAWEQFEIWAKENNIVFYDPPSYLNEVASQGSLLKK